jgi:hypothetical protein
MKKERDSRASAHRRLLGRHGEKSRDVIGGKYMKKMEPNK